MKSWISVWIFVFATGMLIAIMANKEDWKKNRGVALLMVGVMAAAGSMAILR